MLLILIYLIRSVHRQHLISPLQFEKTMKILALFLFLSGFSLSAMERPHSAPPPTPHETHKTKLSELDFQDLLDLQELHPCQVCDSKDEVISALKRELETLRDLCKKLHQDKQQFDKAYVEILKMNIKLRDSRN